MSRRTIGIGLAVLVLLVLAGLWRHYMERVDQVIPLPPRGEAAYNPYYAFQLALRARGYTVTSHASLQLAQWDLQPGDVVVLGAGLRGVSEDQVEQLLDWVGGGGHAVVSLATDEKTATGPLLQALDLTTVARSGCVEWSTAKSERASICAPTRFLPGGDFVWLWGDEQRGYLFGWQEWMDGSLTVAASLEFLDNDNLSQTGHAAFAWQLLAPQLAKAGASVHLVYASDVPSLLVVLVRHGWTVLLPLLLALALWLWSRSQRFGPLQPLPPAHQRALLNHVRAAGEFAFRRGRGAALHAALRSSLLERLRRRDPGLAALHGEALVSALAELHRLPLAEVRQALHPIDLGRADRFFASIKTLLQLRAKS